MSTGSTSSDDKPRRNSSTDDTTPPSTSSHNCTFQNKIRLTTNYPLIPKSHLEVQEQLGVGTYGSVHKGLWKTSTGQQLVVALKKVFMLEKEVDILAQIRHRYIIQLFGVSHANPDFYIVTEYAENGSLYEYLHNDSAEMSCERILKWASQIARGVAYLHYEAPTTIIHRDLKSKNVVIDHKFTCKLCDFGTSKDLTHSWTAPTWGGTAAWMSPEIISQESITTAADVWSYGVLLWEIFTREIPYKGLTEFKIYSIISQEGVKLVIPESCPEHLSNLLKRCWQTNPKDRIQMKEVVTNLAHMKGSKEIQKECEHFVGQKEHWQCKIKEQLDELDALKLDFARRIEDLNRREQALRKRENSHRTFMHLLDFMNFTNVADWNEDYVCEWIQYIALSNPGMEIDEQLIDNIICRVLQHEIRGSRLLQVTEGDLANLGIEDAAIREYIVGKIDDLRLAEAQRNCDLFNFPSLQMSALLENRNKQDKSKSPFFYSIILHVGLYSRVIKTSDGNLYRFKVFLDSDWMETKPTDSIPPEIHDSATVITDVCVSMSASDGTVLLETVRCICPPFGYLEWITVEESRLPIKITIAVTYTDQVLQPRNTCISHMLTKLSSDPLTLCDKNISLKIRPIATNTSLSRLNSSMFNPNIEHITSTNNLQGVWRGRRGSSGLCTSSLDSNALKNLSISKSVWADVVAGTPKTPPDNHHLLPHYTSVPQLSTQSIQQKSNGEISGNSNGIRKSILSKNVPRKSSARNIHRLNPVKLLSTPNTNKRGRRRSEADTNNIVEKEFEEERPNFFLGSTSNTPSPQIQPNSSNEESSYQDSVFKEASNNRCCDNSCRSRKTSIISRQDIQNHEDEIGNVILNEEPKKTRRKKNKKSLLSTPSDITIHEEIPLKFDSSQNSLKKCSQHVYGGNKKWRWKS